MDKTKAKNEWRYLIMNDKIPKVRFYEIFTGKTEDCTAKHGGTNLDKWTRYSLRFEYYYDRKLIFTDTGYFESDEQYDPNGGIYRAGIEDISQVCYTALDDEIRAKC